ncbi:hypothetical protein PLICRDRAFT_292000 [Plicaturopsis crispa FD-325 SS-3]|nr:hypothetical protein PLICRDRAFT_292000 [Plicaturopsis crispa FD-325 SS-3]
MLFFDFRRPRELPRCSATPQYFGQHSARKCGRKLFFDFWHSADRCRRAMRRRLGVRIFAHSISFGYRNDPRARPAGPSDYSTAILFFDFRRPRELPASPRPVFNMSDCTATGSEAPTYFSIFGILPAALVVDRVREALVHNVSLSHRNAPRARPAGPSEYFISLDGDFNFRFSEFPRAACIAPASLQHAGQHRAQKRGSDLFFDFWHSADRSCCRLGAQIPRR